MGTLITDFDTDEERSADITLADDEKASITLVGDLDKGAKAYIEWKRADGAYDIVKELNSGERGAVIEAKGTWAVRKMPSRSNLGVERG